MSKEMKLPASDLARLLMEGNWQVGNYYFHAKSDTVYEIVDAAIREEDQEIGLTYTPVSGPLANHPYGPIKFQRRLSEFVEPRFKRVDQVIGYR